jgi:hypothetical protein
VFTEEEMRDEIRNLPAARGTTLLHYLGLQLVIAAAVLLLLAGLLLH